MCNVDKHCRCAPTRGSQSLTTQSLPPPLATTLLVSCHCTHLTSPPWPFNVVSALALAKSNIFIVASSAHVANFRSLGLKLTPRIGSPWACVCFKLLKFICQYLICPESSAEISQFSLCDTVAVRTGLLCACKIVSKLKLAAFQSVNSPFCEHVSTLRPSGMNITVLTNRIKKERKRETVSEHFSWEKIYIYIRENNSNDRRTNERTRKHARVHPRYALRARVPLFIGVLILFALTCTNFNAKLDAGWCFKFQLGSKSSMLPLVGFTNASSLNGFFATEAMNARLADAIRLFAV